MVIHVVEPGETVYSIANKYGVTIQNVIENNGLINPNVLLPGQAIIILTPALTHRVQEGETLNSIAAQYGTTPIVLMQNNPVLEGRSNVGMGQELVIAYETDRLGEIMLASSAYTTIDGVNLRKSMPYVSLPVTLTFTCTEAGEIIPLNDRRILNAAKEYSAKPLMNFSALNSRGEYDLVLAHRIFTEMMLQDNLINNFIELMTEKGYVTLVLDFQYIIIEDKEDYLDFIRNTAERLNDAGLGVIVRIYTDIAKEEVAVLFEDQDYIKIGQMANAVTLVAFETGYRIGGPGPINPVWRVRDTLDYWVSLIPPEKIFLGIPNFGFDWTLPYRPESSVVRQITNAEAINLAAQKLTDIHFDTEAMSPYFYYRDSRGAQHVVYFGDARSVNSRAGLAAEYHLMGITVWTMMQNYQPYWSVLNSLYDIKKTGDF